MVIEVENPLNLSSDAGRGRVSCGCNQLSEMKADEKGYVQI